MLKTNVRVLPLLCDDSCSSSGRRAVWAKVKTCSVVFYLRPLWKMSNVPILGGLNMTDDGDMFTTKIIGTPLHVRCMGRLCTAVAVYG